MNNEQIRIKRVDDRLVWNVYLGKEHIGIVINEDYSLVYKEEFSPFAPDHNKDDIRMAALWHISQNLSNEDQIRVKTNDEPDLVNEISEFLGELGVNENECDCQALALIKCLRKKYVINKKK